MHLGNDVRLSMGSSRHRLCALAGALLLAACGKVEGPRACAGPSDCAADAFCRAGRCAASAAPVARLVAPAGASAGLPSHTVVHFDGSASFDPDPEDHVAAYSWTARPVTAGCDPFPKGGTDPAIDLVFGCAGGFEVRLSVIDSTGRSSAPEAVQVAVSLSADVPTVQVGADQAVDHACDGDPLLCRALPAAGTAGLALSAVGHSPTGSAISYAWSAAPPTHSGQAPPRVVIDPVGGAAPALRIESDGGPIAGDYLFTVRATDAFGLVAIGQQRVTVGNRPPVITGGGTVLLHHGFDAAARRFTASGPLPAFAVVDPDGDPVGPLAFSVAHSGDGDATFTVEPTAAGADLAIAVPYTTVASALHLVGGPGLSRTVDLVVADVNGARAMVSWDVQVQNRAPRLVGAPSPVTVGHTFDAASSTFRAQAPLLAAVDDDGDPIVQRGPTGDAACSVSEVVGSGTLSALCTQAYTGMGSLASLVGVHDLDLVVGDPWTVLRPGAARVAIGDRPPRVLPVTVLLNVACGPYSCCRANGDGCLDLQAAHGAGSVALPVTAVDDDGDPLEVSYGQSGCAHVLPATATCDAGGCGPVEASVCGEKMACGISSYPIAVTASDGAGSASGTLVLDSGCSP